MSNYCGRRAAGGAALLACALVAALAAPAIARAELPAWSTYDRGASRTGVDPDSVSPLPPAQLWRTPALDGQVYGQPLVYGDAVFVATEDDTLYALNAATGAIEWQASAGTPVPAGELPCGDIAPVVGITSTPVIDPLSRRIYVVADTWNGSNPATIAHQLAGFALGDGSPEAGLPTPVDPPGTAHAAQLQRAALALDGGRVIIGYGGNAGDCGTYNGWLVAAPETGGGPLASFEVGAGGLGGAIWGAGAGPAVDGSGNIWVATGNGLAAGGFGYQESVLQLGENLALLDHWAPSDWATLDSTDADLGSSEPLLLPDGLVFQSGKQGIGYLLRAASLGGTGGAPLFQAQVCRGAYGAPIYAAGAIYVPCSDGVHALALSSASDSFAPLAGWSVNPTAVGPPIFAGGLIWSAGTSNGVLYGLDPATGAISFSAPVGSFVHFSAPSAAGGSLFVAAGDTVSAFRIAATPPPSATVTALAAAPSPATAGAQLAITASVSPVPDAGTVTFTTGGTPVPGCVGIGVSYVTGQAVCPASFPAAARLLLRATYSGDAYYQGSSTAALTELVLGPGGAPRLSQLRLTRHGRATLRLTLSEPAGVTVVIARLEAGREPTPAKGCRLRARKGRRCTARIRTATLHFAGRRGGNRFALRLGKLAPGRYALLITAQDGAGRRSATRTLQFAISASRAAAVDSIAQAPQDR